MNSQAALRRSTSQVEIVTKERPNTQQPVAANGARIDKDFYRPKFKVSTSEQLLDPTFVPGYN